MSKRASSSPGLTSVPSSTRLVTLLFQPGGAEMGTLFTAASSPLVVVVTAKVPDCTIAVGTAAAVPPPSNRIPTTATTITTMTTPRDRFCLVLTANLPVR